MWDTKCKAWSSKRLNLDFNGREATGRVEAEVTRPFLLRAGRSLGPSSLACCYPVMSRLPEYKGDGGFQLVRFRA